MSKKETEFDRYDRMKKLEREVEVQKQKENEIFDDIKNKKNKKSKFNQNDLKFNKKRIKNYTSNYDYIIEYESELK